MKADQVQIEDSWRSMLADEFAKNYFDQIVDFLKQEKKLGKMIYPPGNKIFQAFKETTFKQVKVVILGQDPYHRAGQAMGLSFSVPPNIKIPPSLKNIFKEIKNDLGIEPPNHGDLTTWAQQGVFLLNAMLTVEESKAGSHKKLGWQQFTDAVISTLSEHTENVVFMLWGNFAKSKKELIDANKHLILESAHPSPLAGNRFFNQHHFSSCNKYLTQHNKKEISWKINNI